MKYPALLIVLTAMILASCSSGQTDTDRQILPAEGPNPAQPGFDHEGSDPEAVAIADRVMAAMGGRKAWDNTRHIRWNFFGFRTLYWDKWNGDVRVEIPSANTRILLNINTNTGRFWRDGEEITQPDSVSKYVQQGKSIWINDSYWLVMPYKLKDSGVTLSYLGTGELNDGTLADLIELRFRNVGNTPDNKYHIWVNKETNLVSQWAYFREYDMEAPNFTGAWTDYNKYDEIVLSGGRGDREISEIAVFRELPGTVYTSFSDVEIR